MMSLWWIESVSILFEIAILVQIWSERSQRFQLSIQIYARKSSLIFWLEHGWTKRHLLPVILRKNGVRRSVFPENFSDSVRLVSGLPFWKPKKIGPLWDNYQGSVPKEPYQPEYVILTMRKYKNGTITLESAEIHSDNLEYPSNSPVAKLIEYWFICNEKSDFMLATIDQANTICKRMNSTIKTYYSKNDMLKFMTRVILAPSPRWN